MQSAPTQAYDVLVIGGGHAGIEAALAVARLGGRVGLLTQNLDTIGQMSCNPAIGGLAKGHMVNEIDALGGAMGLNTDATALQLRVLNASKGPSVQALRAQCDKSAYRARMKWLLERTSGLELLQGDVSEICVENGRAVGALQRHIHARAAACGQAVSAGREVGLRAQRHLCLSGQVGLSSSAFQNRHISAREGGEY